MSGGLLRGAFRRLPWRFNSSIAHRSNIIPYFEGVQEHVGQNTVEIDLDTLETVQRLQSTGFSPKQSEVITDLMSWILRVRLNEMKRSLVSSSQAEYDLSMISEIFDEIQTSFSAVISKDSVEIRGLNDKYSSEISRLLDGLKESASSARTDLAINVNSFKADSIEEVQRIGMQVHQEDSRLNVRMGGFKTETENVKLKAIYSFSVVLCLACVMVAAKAKSPKKAKKPEEPPSSEIINTS